MIKLYHLDHDLLFDIKIAIDHSVCTDEMLHSINDFFGDSKYRLSSARGDIAVAVVKMIANQAALADIRGYGLNAYGVMEAFNHDAKYGNKGIEGFPKLDGSSGIYLVSFENFEFDYTVTGVEELKEKPKLPVGNI